MASKLLLLLLVLCSLNVAQCGLKVYNLYATGLRPDPIGQADGFVKMTCGSVTKQTDYKKDTPNPSWKGVEYTFPKASDGDVLKFKVYDKDVAFNDLLGSFSITVKKNGDVNKRSLAKGGVLHYSYKFI